MVGAVPTVSTATETVARFVIFSVKVAVAVFRAVIVFAEILAIAGIADAALALDVFAVTTEVIVEFKIAICALASSMAVCTDALLGSGVGINAAPWLIVPLNPAPEFVSVIGVTVPLVV